MPLILDDISFNGGNLKNCVEGKHFDFNLTVTIILQLLNFETRHHFKAQLSPYRHQLFVCDAFFFLISALTL